MIIVAFSMVVLLGICALVVDLGLSWMLRRQEQNAADPASIAAARYIEEGDIGRHPGQDVEGGVLLFAAERLLRQ